MRSPRFLVVTILSFSVVVLWVIVFILPIHLLLEDEYVIGPIYICPKDNPRCIDVVIQFPLCSNPYVVFSACALFNIFRGLVFVLIWLAITLTSCIVCFMWRDCDSLPIYRFFLSLLACLMTLIGTISLMCLSFFANENQPASFLTAGWLIYMFALFLPWIALICMMHPVFKWNHPAEAEPFIQL